MTGDVTVSPAAAVPADIAAALAARGTIYQGDAYSGLITPATVDIAAAAVPRLHAELNAVWEWNRVWHDLYACDPVAPMLALSDYGLPHRAIAAQRRPSVLNRDPHIGRVDSIDLSPRQAVAEVQWKGGGEGFAAGIQDAYLGIIPCRAGQEPLGGLLADGWARFYHRYAHADRPFVVTSTRDTWQRSEQHLIDALGSRGVDFTFIARQTVGGRLRVRGRQLEAPWNGRWRRVDYLSLDRLSEALPDPLFAEVLEAYEDGTVHIEPPPSYLYSQKLGYALPWHPAYRDAFSDEVRSVLIPTVCLNEGPAALAGLVAAVEHREAARLAGLASWDDVQKLPDTLRRRIVVKCASINGALNHGGRGVWRLGSAATLTALIRRVERGEPWIAQPYLDRTLTAPLSDGAAVQRRRVHARFCLYAIRRAGAEAGILGGLATLSTFWKAAGKNAAVDGRGRLIGSAFVDLRTIHMSANGI